MIHEKDHLYIQIQLGSDYKKLCNTMNYELFGVTGF